MEAAVDPKYSENHVRIVSVSEILLPSPMLNMIIVDTKIDHNKSQYIEHFNSGMCFY